MADEGGLPVSGGQGGCGLLVSPLSPSHGLPNGQPRPPAHT